jgi:hypothetical protein
MMAMHSRAGDGKSLFEAAYFFLGGLAFCLSILAASGCNVVTKKWVTVEQTTSVDADMVALKQGDEAFRRGDFQRAMAIFRDLRQKASDESISRNALYGFACAKLALAEDPSDLSEAMLLWNTWDQLMPGKWFVEDPRMLTPFLERMATTETNEKERAETAKSLQETTYRGLLRIKEKKIRDLTSKLETTEKEVQTLKHQIDSLEAIHQKIQEKKKEVSSP